MIACIDPGVSANGGTGIAYFSESGLLLEAYLVRAPKVDDVADRINSMLLDLRTPPRRVRLCLVEWPQIYRGSPVNPNYLLGLSGAAMAIASRLEPEAVSAILPRVWKGRLDADKMTKVIDAAITAGERITIHECPKSLRHNVLDAIGIGLWHFGRIGGNAK